MARSRVVNLANFEQFTAINLLSDPGHIPGKVQIPQVAQIRLIWILEDGKNAFNVLHGRYTGGFAGTQAQATAIHQALSSGGTWTALAAFFASTNLLGGVDIRDLNALDQPLIPATSGPVAGTSASPSLPNETAAVISLRTSKVGPANRGRVYVPGWATNSLGSGNVIAAAAVTALNNWSAVIKSAFTAQGYSLCIAQPARNAYVGSSGTSHPARAAGSTDVSTLSVRDNHWDSQRRRGLK